MIKLIILVGAMFALTAQALPEPKVSIAFDEGAGCYADDAASGLCAELTPAAKWASGAFGTALATGANDASALLKCIPGMGAADRCTVFLRFRKDGASSGKYPCILSSRSWESGGIMLFSDGKDLRLRLRAGANGPEASWCIYGKIPEGRWCSVAVVFDKPNVTVYADGKAVAKAKWNHPFVVRDLEIGGWYESSFGGFVDDLRIWNEVVQEQDIVELASDSRYAEIEGYQDDGTGGIQKTQISGQAGRTFRKYDNSAVELAFDTLGCISSLREKASGRWMQSPSPFRRKRVQRVLSSSTF